MHYEAANKGHIKSQRALGIMFQFGQSTQTADFAEAAKWYAMGAEQNDSISCLNLGGLYYQGNGLTKDVEKDLDLIKRSADLGFEEAQLVIGHKYFIGENLPRDIGKALYYLRKASKQANAETNFFLGYAYLFYESAEQSDPFSDSVACFNEIKTGPYLRWSKKFLSLLSKGYVKAQPNEIYELEDLVGLLFRQHRRGQYFRGQSNLYDGPLLPPSFRYQHAKHPINFEGDSRLRNVGRSFYFESLESKTYKPAEYVKQAMNATTNQALGYPLTQAFFQQAGYSS